MDKANSRKITAAAKTILVACCVASSPAYSSGWEDALDESLSSHPIQPSLLVFNDCRPVAVGDVDVEWIRRLENGEISTGSSPPPELLELSRLMRSEAKRVLADAGLLYEPPEKGSRFYPVLRIASFFIGHNNDYMLGAVYMRPMTDPVTGQVDMRLVWEADPDSSNADVLRRLFGVTLEGNHNGDSSYVVYQVRKLTEAFVSAYSARNNEETCSGSPRSD